MTKEYYDLSVKENWMVSVGSTMEDFIRKFQKPCRCPEQIQVLDLKDICDSANLDETCIVVMSSVPDEFKQYASLTMMFFAEEWEYLDDNQLCMCNCWTDL